MDERRVRSADEWEDVVSRNFYALQLGGASEGFRASVRSAELGRGVSVSEVAAEPSELVRTRRLIRAEPSDDLLFLLQLSGTSRIEQGGRQLELRAGTATFFDPGVPYAISATTRQQQIVTMVPRREVVSPGASPADFRLQPLSMSAAPLRVFRLLAEEIASDPGDGSDDTVATVATELLRSAATTAAIATLDLRSWSHETVLRAARTYILQHLSDSAVTMEQIAGAVGCSVRRLSSVFAPDDTPAGFLRRERLRRAREDLLDPRWASVPMADIGARWGYPEPSTFGRAYRRAYGQTPGATRRER